MSVWWWRRKKSKKATPKNTNILMQNDPESNVKPAQNINPDYKIRIIKLSELQEIKFWEKEHTVLSMKEFGNL